MTADDIALLNTRVVGSRNSPYLSLLLRLRNRHALTAEDRTMIDE